MKDLARESVAPVMQYVALFALGLATFSRLLESGLGFPRAVNWIHFPLVCIAFAGSLRRVEKDAVPVLAGVFALLLVFAISALVNRAGAINALLGYLLLAEPFLLLAVLINTPPSAALARAVATSVLFFALAQIPIALFQWPQAIALKNPDYVQGSFRGMGAGAHVLGAISMAAAFYILWAFPRRRLWLRASLAAALFGLVAASDSKQVILAFAVGYVLVELRKIGSWRAAARLGAQVLLFSGATYLVFRWFDPRLYLQEVASVLRDFARKFEVFTLITDRFDAPAGWIFGLGPGHTVSRMGGWLIDEYWHLLEPLGATRTDLHEQAMHLPWMVSRISSLYQPMFSWAGIFGDLGLAGIAVYGGLLCAIYARIGADRVARLLLIVVVLLGFIFDWLEEYNFMLFIAAVIGQRWLASRSGQSESELGGTRVRSPLDLGRLGISTASAP